MRRILMGLAVIGALMVCAQAFASPSVTNVRASQRTDGSGMVDVYYNLSDGAGPMKVSVVFSDNDGSTWNVRPNVGKLSGDVGDGVYNGTNRHIVWDAGGDRPGVQWTNARAKISATYGFTGETLTVTLPHSVPMEMVLIPGGSFQMGSDPQYDSWASSSEQPRHWVDIDSFYMCQTEVTQGQWMALMNTWPDSIPTGGDDYPAYYVSWNDCKTFITALNALGQGTFRLPSESEWEYACRAGSESRFSFGDSDCASSGSTPCNLNDYAWWAGNNSPSGPKIVGQLLPNAFGLYDMHGNMWEWCEDDYHSSYNSTSRPDDGSAWVDNPRGSYRVLRGGDWNYIANYCRSAYRNFNDPSLPRNYNGFRVVRTQ